MDSSEAVPDPDLPRSVKLAWGLLEPGSRGPRRGLSLDRILDTAVELADAEGVEALSMARLAKRLGFTTMSLYRYVASKDELVELISDRVIGPPPDIPAGGPWRQALEQWARAEYGVLMSHRWWLQLSLGAVPPTGPNNIAWLDVGLGALAGTPLPVGRRFQVVLNTSLYVIGRARFAADFLAAQEEPAGQAVAEVDYGAVIGALIEKGSYPHLSEALAGGAFASEPEVEWSDGDFAFALDLFLDGVERLIDEYS